MDNEWTYNFEVEELTDEPVTLCISPNEEVCGRLAKRLGIEKLKSLSADLKILREAGFVRIYVKGVIKAHIFQNCIISAESVETNLEESFEAWFADLEEAVSLAKVRRERQMDKSGVEVPILDEYEDPEDVIDGKIDLGELVVQFLSLAIEPYPYAPGHEPSEEDEDPRTLAQLGEVPNPFAALKDWKFDKEK